MKLERTDQYLYLHFLDRGLTRADVDKRAVRAHIHVGPKRDVTPLQATDVSALLSKFDHPMSGTQVDGAEIGLHCSEMCLSINSHIRK